MTAAITAPSVPLPARAGVTVRRRVRPRPAVDINRMTRYRGGTYSHTVDTIVFVDGTVARTDLIRLNPNVEAYSLDFSGISPTKPSRYLVQTWTAVPNVRAHAYEVEVDWILRNSFPNLKTGELSRRLRAEGHLVGHLGGLGTSASTRQSPPPRPRSGPSPTAWRSTIVR